jgi:hypothetical protein
LGDRLLAATGRRQLQGVPAEGGRSGRFQAAYRLGHDLPAQAKSDKSQGVRGTESPDFINQTLKKTEKLVSVFSGEVQVALLLDAISSDDDSSLLTAKDLPLLAAFKTLFFDPAANSPLAILWNSTVCPGS